jgi:hypothetical protein
VPLSRKYGPVVTDCEILGKQYRCEACSLNQNLSFIYEYEQHISAIDQVTIVGTNLDDNDDENIADSFCICR